MIDSLLISFKGDGLNIKSSPLQVPPGQTGAQTPRIRLLLNERLGGLQIIKDSLTKQD